MASVPRHVEFESNFNHGDTHQHPSHQNTLVSKTIGSEGVSIKTQVYIHVFVFDLPYDD